MLSTMPFDLCYYTKTAAESPTEHKAPIITTQPLKIGQNTICLVQYDCITYYYANNRYQFSRVSSFSQKQDIPDRDWSL